MLKILTDFINFGCGVSLFVNSLLFIPQIVTLWRNKHANDISLLTFAGFNIINTFIFLHALIMNDVALIFGYGFTLLVNSIVTVLIIWYRYFAAKKTTVKY